MLPRRLHDAASPRRPSLFALPLVLLACAGRDAPAPQAAAVVEVAAPVAAVGPDPKEVEATSTRLIVAKRYDEARRLAEECLAARPDACECLDILTELALRRHAATEGFTRASAAAERCPKRGRSASLVVLALLEQGRPEIAEAEARRRLATDGADPHVTIALATALSRSNRAGEAMVQARRAVAMGAGRDAKILVAALAINADQLDEAERLLHEIVEAYDDDPDAHFDLGIVADRRGDAERALHEYDAALRLDPKHHDALKNSALLCWKAGRAEEARAYAQKLVEAHPDSPDAARIQKRVNPPAPRPIRPHTGTVQPSADDPLHGRWTLADATRGLPPGTKLSAILETSLGTLECRLFDREAPITVANFIGLARGTRPWKTPSGRWQKLRAYDGTVFHRIIRGFMIQGGDPKKNGSGDAGYLVPDEIWDGGRHDRAGLLCAANRGPDTNSVQFFITDDAAPHLDGGYTIFGECGPLDIVHQIAGVSTAGDRPVQPQEIKKVTVIRR